MEKLTSTKYVWSVTTDGQTGTKVVLHNTLNFRSENFLIADNKVKTQRVIDHMKSLTDEQCDQWLDPEATEKAKAAAKEIAKVERAAAQQQAIFDREEKVRKKEENKRKQREALQRKQESDSN